jgi:hypothetical protein
MKIQTNIPPLVLILTSTLFAITTAKSNVPIAGGVDVGRPVAADLVDTADLVTTAAAKIDVGRKDAPVDGFDGKPHAGPFVDTSVRNSADSPSTAQKPSVAIKGAPQDPMIVDGVKVPEKNDGVMNDPARLPPKEGTTGAEGGVSEKDKLRKAHEGQTGEKLEKEPSSPKEAPVAPPTGKEKPLVSEKDGKAKAKGKDFDELSGDTSELSGLEVSSLCRPGIPC